MAMSSPSVTMRSGLYAEQVVGLRLSSVEAGQLRDKRLLAETLAQAIREAIAAARMSGVSAFSPDSALLVLALDTPESLNSVADIFAQVLGVPYRAVDELRYQGLPAFDALSLEQWSKAEATLAEHVARLSSMLAPGEGGGVHHARGHWFVNGQGFTLAEMVMAIRMGNLNGLDKTLEADLNTMLANTTLARQLLSILANMKWQRGQLEADTAEGFLGPEFDGVAHYGVFVEAAGLSVERLKELGTRFKGENSYLSRAGFAAEFGTLISSADYDDTMIEIQSLFDSVNTENDVKRSQVQARQNERMNMLEGMSNFYSGVSAVNLIAARNLG
ncbi:MAG: hypothetical protein RI942_1732 [Pseudomonadota bacterium]|jgi:hypothetical protein